MAQKPPKRPLPIQQEDTIQGLPRAASQQTRQALGKITREDSVSIHSPSPIKKGTKVVPRGAVGLRAAPMTQEDSLSRSVQALSEVREKVLDSKETRRQSVWRKLDDAKSKRDEKIERLRAFQPARTNAGHDPESDD